MKPMTPLQAKENIQKKCGLEDKTMLYLSNYKYADDLFLKLWKASAPRPWRNSAVIALSEMETTDSVPHGRTSIREKSEFTTVLL